MIILGIETSCDETAAALISCQRGRLRIISNIVASQMSIHQKYGGVVPEVAARSHVQMILGVIKRAIGSRRPDVISVTAGPGLVTSLLVGVHTARTLSFIWGAPLVAVNHIEGHIYANFLSSSGTLRFPALALIVSGGHTELHVVKAHGRYTLLGRTRDDAAGEAFDKGAAMLGLGYPGGPAISAYARNGNVSAYSFPHPMLGSAGYEFSFSGLKTALLYTVRDIKKSGKQLTKRAVADLCASYEQAIVHTLAVKTARAAAEYTVKSVVAAGGVVANTRLRSELHNLLEKRENPTPLYYPPQALCTDNAVMIAAAGAYRARMRKYTHWKRVAVRAQWHLEDV